MATTEQSNDLRERPLGDVAGQLMQDVSLLVRQEMKLAKAEMQEKGRTAAFGLGMIGGAGVVALCALGALTAFLILVFAVFLDSWLAALLIGLMLAAVAATLAYVGKERVSDVGPPIPEQAIENVKEDAQWVKEQAKSART